jgi:tryptophanyl-tRNA synthetase
MDNDSTLTQGTYLEENFGLNQFTDENKSQLITIDENLLSIIEYHRGFDTFAIQNKSSYYLYTGRGPSQGTLHIGHLLGLELIRSLSKLFESKIFFMIADDEKIMRDSIDVDTMELNVSNTIKQLEKIGFTEDCTKYHINSKDITQKEYQIMIKLMSLVTVEQLSNIFGKKDNIGEYFYVFYQMAPCFIHPDKQCIVVAGVDQDPFFRLARHLAKKIGSKPPIILYTKSVPGLDGSEKMSTSVPSSNPIFLSDTPEIIKNKIFNIKKVGAGTLDELFEKGADLNSDTLIKLARLYEKNKNLLNIIEKGYTIGFNNLEISDNIEINAIKQIIPDKGIYTKGTKTMITTLGVRFYLTNLFNNIIYKYY